MAVQMDANRQMTYLSTILISVGSFICLFNYLHRFIYGAICIIIYAVGMP